MREITELRNHWQEGEFLCAMIQFCGTGHWWLDTQGYHKFCFMKNERPYFSEEVFPFY